MLHALSFEHCGDALAFPSSQRQLGSRIGASVPHVARVPTYCAAQADDESNHTPERVNKSSKLSSIIRRKQMTLQVHMAVCLLTTLVTFLSDDFLHGSQSLFDFPMLLASAADDR